MGDQPRRASLWDRAKQGATNAAAATQRTAKRTKLKTDIQLLNRDIRLAKAEFGVQAYDLAVNGDWDAVGMVASDKRIKIDNWTQTVEAKKAEIQRLNEESVANGEKLPPKSEYEDNNDDYGDYSYQQQQKPVPPPPPPPPPA